MYLAHVTLDNIFSAINCWMSIKNNRIPKVVYKRCTITLILRKVSTSGNSKNKSSKNFVQNEDLNVVFNTNYSIFGKMITS